MTNINIAPNDLVSKVLDKALAVYADAKEALQYTEDEETIKRLNTIMFECKVQIIKLSRQLVI